MRIVKLSELNEKERKEYERQRSVREQNTILEREKEIERVSNLINNANDSSSNNVLPKANKFNISITEPITNKEKYEANTIVKSSQAFKDGYQIGDVSKTVGSTLANVGTNLWQGVHNTGAGIGKALAGGVAQVADFVGQDEYADKVRKNMTEETPLDKLVRESNEATSKNSVLGQKTGNVIQGIGNIGATVAAQAVGVPWQATTGLSSVGSGLSEAYQEGATDLEAWLSAGLSAGAEVGSEYLFGGIKLPGTGKTADAIIDGLADKIKNNAVKQITKMGINAVGEGAEEVISGIGNALSKKMTYMSEKELSELYSSEDALNDFVTGTITSSIVGGGQQIHQNNIANQNAQQKIREAQDIINNVANNTQTMYNKANERESGINGNIERHIVEGRNGIYKEQKSEQIREYNWKEYNEWEQSIRPIESNGLTNSERQSIKRAKKEHNKDVIVFDENENSSKYSAGASRTTNNKIMISRQKAETFGLDNMINHETVESDILFNEEARDILEPTIKMIIEDQEFQRQKEKFWIGQDGNIPSDELIAKDIVCDRFSEIKTGRKIDYENVLSNSTNFTIDEALKSYYKQVYGKDINETDSVSGTDNSMSHFGPESVSNNIIPQNNSNMQVQQEVVASAKNNMLSTSERWAKQNNKKQALNNVTKVEEPRSMDLPSNKKKEQENKIANVLTKPIKQQKPEQRTWALIMSNFVDKGAVFENLSLKLGDVKDRTLQAKYDAMLRSGAKGQYAIGNDRYVLENGKKTLQAKSLTSIIDEVGENASAFYNYMYHQLNIDRMTLEERAKQRIEEIKNKYMIKSTNEELQQLAEEELQEWARKRVVYKGKQLYDDVDTQMILELKELKQLASINNKPVFGKTVEAKHSKEQVAEYEKQYPEFKSYAQDVYDFLDANKAELVKNGVISQELSDKLKEMYPHYVPIARVNKNNNAIQVPLDSRRTGVNSPLKRAKGGSDDIQPLFQTMANNTLQTYTQSARNAFGVELKNTLQQLNVLNSTNENADVNSVMEMMEDEQQTGLTEGTKYKNPTFTVFENGKRVTYDINLDIYDALKPQSEKITKFNDSKGGKVLNTVNNVRRGLLTEYNIIFSITNPIKDSQDILLNSQHATDTYAKIPEACTQIVNKGYWYNEYIQNGGEQNSYFKDGEFQPKESVLKAKNVITIPFRAVSKLNNVIEMTPRLAEYIASRESGRSIETSMLDAARVTTNFKAGGDITKFANRNGFTFLNAGVQGLAQQVRNIREANAKGLKGYAVLLGKMAVAGLPVLLLNNLLWSDDDDYEELQDYAKDRYYIVGKTGENHFITIPKGRTVSVLQKMLSTVDKYVSKDKEINVDNFAEDFWSNIVFAVENIAPSNPLDNNIFAPLMQAAQNKTWYGEDLVPTSLQNVPKAEQYDETTDKFSRWLGQTLNISPMKINYVLEQYGGISSSLVLPLGTPQAEANAFEDKFTVNSILKNKNPGEFYSKLEKLETSNNSINANDTDILKYKYMSSVSSEMSELYKQKREVQSSTDDDATKKKKVEEIQKQINKLAKNGLGTVDNVKINNKTATIGDKKYYKTTNVKDGSQTWKELTEEEMAKNKNISLTTYANYKENIAKETINQRKNGTIDEDGSLKNKDKISLLINSNYTDNEKTALYENYIKSKDDDKYDIIKTTGININSYLKYKLAESNDEFKAEKTDDGTVKGKTVSGSAKDKRYNYIISMQGISNTQKLILWALEYEPSTNNEKQRVINYVKSLQITKDEKLDILSNFKGVTIYKDGTIKY